MWEFLKLAEAMGEPTKIKVACCPDLIPEGKMYVYDMREVMFGLDETIQNSFKVDEEVTRLLVVGDPRTEFKVRSVIEERGEELRLELVD